MLSRGMTAAEMGHALRLSADTIKSHLRTVYARLNVSNGPHAVRVAVERGLVDVERPRCTRRHTNDATLTGVNDQRRPIDDYRDLSEREVALVNGIKQLEREVGEYWLQVRDDATDADARCLALARTKLQDGFMWFVRAVTRPGDPFERRRTET